MPNQSMLTSRGYTATMRTRVRMHGEDNVRFMREVSRKYDPEGLFQKRMRSGVKISEVK